MHIYNAPRRALGKPTGKTTRHLLLLKGRCSGLLLLLSNVQEQCWVWNNEGTEYFYDKHEWVRIRIEQEHWHDQSPVAPSERESAAAMERKSPFSITVCCSIRIYCNL